jgi:hypothetical protein
MRVESENGISQEELVYFVTKAKNCVLPAQDCVLS